MDRLEHTETAALRWLLGQLLVLVSLAGCFALDLGADALITAGLVLAAAACALPRLLERIPRLFWRLAPVPLLAAIVADFALSGGDVLPPLFRMILLLTLFRALQMRTPREDMQLLLLTLFLLVVSGVLSQEVTFGLQLLVYAPAAMGLLFAVNLAHREPGAGQAAPSGPVFAGHAWPALLRRALARLDRRTLLAGAWLFMLATGMALLLFILMPRFDIGAALPFPRLLTGKSLTGFTDHVRYGDVVDILDDDAIAMRVDVESGEPPARPYWRMVVLDAYYDGGFMVSPRVAREYRLNRNYRFEFEYPKGEYTPDGSVWTVYLEGGVSSYLPAADAFRALQFQNRTNLQMHELTRVYRTSEANANTLSVRYESPRFGGVLPLGSLDEQLPGLRPVAVDTASPAYLRKVGYPQTLLAVPDGAENAAILGRLVRAAGHRQGMPAGEFAERLVESLQAGRGYSLESSIPAGEADRLLRWVGGGGSGHCELYAGAFVLAARYAGFPARMVTGFAGGDWNGFENYFMVRNRHAHAWCEIYDAGRGWLRADPTPGYAAAGSLGDALAGGRLVSDRTWRARLDSLRILWFRRVIQFDAEEQQLMAETARGLGLRGLGWVREALGRAREVLRRDWDAAAIGGDWRALADDLSLPAAAVVAVAVLVFLIRRRRRRAGFEAIMRRRAGLLLQARQARRLPRDAVHETLERVRYGPVSEWPPKTGRVLTRRFALRGRAGAA